MLASFLVVVTSVVVEAQHHNYVLSDHFIDQTFTKTLIQPTPVTTCPLWTFLTMTQRKYTTTHDTFGVVKYIIKTF